MVNNMLVNTPLGYILFGVMCIFMIGFCYENNKFLKNYKEYGWKTAYRLLLTEGILKRMLIWFCFVIITCLTAIMLSS